MELDIGDEHRRKGLDGTNDIVGEDACTRWKASSFLVVIGLDVEEEFGRVGGCGLDGEDGLGTRVHESGCGYGQTLGWGRSVFGDEEEESLVFTKKGGEVFGEHVGTLVVVGELGEGLELKGVETKGESERVEECGWRKMGLDGGEEGVEVGEKRWEFGLLEWEEDGIEDVVEVLSILLVVGYREGFDVDEWGGDEGCVHFVVDKGGGLVEDGVENHGDGEEGGHAGFRRVGWGVGEEVDDPSKEGGLGGTLVCPKVVGELTDDPSFVEVL